MARTRVHDGHYTLDDGLGDRVVATNVRHGLVEMLTVSPHLAAQAGVEQAIRARGARYADIDGATVAVVRRIDCDESGLRVFADSPQGIRLSSLLAQLDSSADGLPDPGMLELVSTVIRAVAALHHLPGTLSHGAISPAHIVVTPDGNAVLTDAVCGAAVAALQQNREFVWREFGLALPPSASLPKFDRRADVTQLGAVVLAIALRRPLTPDEYPRAVADLLIAATPDSAHHGSALRMWLQQALQLHPRSTFASAVEAQNAFAQFMPAPGIRRSGKQTLLALLTCTTSFSTLRAS